MGNSRLKLLFVAAAYGAQGMQLPADIHTAEAPRALQLAQDVGSISVSPGTFPLNRTIDDVSAVEEIRAETSRLLTPTLLQYFMALTQNNSHALVGNGSAKDQLTKTESFILNVIDAESTALLEEWHSLEHQSRASAAELASLASHSANFSGVSFVEQVALQSAGIVRDMRALELQSASKNGKAGPSHAFPQAHVVSRRAPGSRATAAQKAEAAFTATAAENALAQTQFAVGSWRLSLAVAGACTVILSTLFAITSLANRNGFSFSKKSMSFVKYVREPAEGTGSHCGPHEADKALSVWDGTVATFSTIVGTGLLAMPYAFSLAGLVAAPVIVFFVCCSAYTAHLMAWSLNANAAEAELRGLKPASRGWGFLMEVAFGRKAKSAINAFLIVELWGYLLSATVCSAMNVTQVVEDLSMSAAIGISVCVAYALTFVPVNLLTKVNVLSNVVFMACCVMFIITGLSLPEKAPASDVQWVDPRGLISAAGILVFSPAGHGFYPSLMQRMEEPTKFPMCIRRAYVAAVIVYLVVAISGYHLFGREVKPSAVQNIGADLHLVPIPHLGWMNTLAAMGMVIKMMAMQGLVLTPLTSTVEGVLAGVSADSSLTFLVAPSILAVSAGVAMHFASEMATLLNLIGSVFCMNIAFVVPVICYWKLAREPVGLLRQVVFVSLILLGGTFAILGVLTTL
uniref:Amino acid transporter transmembrane domain-containing protein n=1 Tax=Alexandrium catenella TaxID=2925 RepID=A0A7S1SBK0_ALECA|mmetsp:Transcript_94363/g.250635  ORF Transcript_94363/g.250635 Transcript_94363/m.250635 type:complete len:686 (+) Transcript_94363:92-2149(+)